MIKRLIVISLIVCPILLTASRTNAREISPKTYTVKSGDSLYTIAKKFKITIDALKKSNRTEENSLLHPGQKLILPKAHSRKAASAATPPTKKRVDKTSRSLQKSVKKSRKSDSGLHLYKVKAGDTLSAIAQEKGVSVKELRKINHMKPGSLIKVGQVLTLPGSKHLPKKETPNPSAKQEKQTGMKNRTAPAEKDEKNIHVVRYGDTLFSIARSYHTPLKDLMTLNGIAPTDLIHPGQKLKIPGSSYRAQKVKRQTAKTKIVKTEKKKSGKPEFETVKPVVYIVKHGDTLWKIAQKQKVSVAQIRLLNKIKRHEIIRSGMKLMIKKGTGTPGQLAGAHRKEAPQTFKKTYTVRRGDSLWKIAKKYKISVAEIRHLNKLKRGEVIHSGTKLTVGYEKVPPTRLAKQKQVKKKPKKKIAKKVTAKIHLAKSSTKRKSRKRKSADKRISSALSALNGKSGGGSGGSGGGDYNVIRVAKRYLGHRYVWGAEGPRTFDCSGFTQYVMRKSKGARIPRVSRKQAYYGKYITRSHLKPGDLIFFDTSHSRRGYVNHVGIYIGNNKFIHASSARHRVVITSLNRPFYRARFKWGRRIN